MGSYKNVKTRIELESALTCSDIESLRDEITEWRDNMDGSGLENTSKYEEVSECADGLDNVDSLDDPLSGLLESAEKMGIKEEMVEVSQYVNRRKGRGPARWVRLSNEMSAIRAGVERIKEEIEKKETILQEQEEEDEDLREVVDEANEHAEELEGCLEELENVSFPGMY
jgi:DNA repair exonuclease SbcCD ATPase subunit